jgi:hypothetical protein
MDKSQRPGVRPFGKRAVSAAMIAVLVPFLGMPASQSIAAEMTPPDTVSVLCPNSDKQKKVRTIAQPGQGKLRLNIYCADAEPLDDTAPSSTGTSTPTVAKPSSTLKAALVTTSESTPAPASQSLAPMTIAPSPIASPSTPSSAADATQSRTVDTRRLTLSQVFALFELMLGTVLMGWAMVRSRYGGIIFRRYWGGFGGEGTGWYASPGLVALTAGVLLILVAAGMLIPIPSPVPSSSTSTTTVAALK